MNEINKKEIARFQAKRNVVSLYKSFLILLEDLRTEHDSNFQKLEESLPDSIILIKQARFMEPKRMEYLRKKVLDAGNDCDRNIADSIERI